MITPEQIDAVAKLIPGKEHVVILTHLSPDGDAMGSALGLKLWLRDCGCADVQVIVPNLYPDFLAWLPTAGEIIIYGTHKDAAEQAVHNADLLFCVDFNEPKRIGDAAELLGQTHCPKVLIDHHLNPDHAMVDIVISYPEAPAACYLVLELINGINEVKGPREAIVPLEGKEGSKVNCPREAIVRASASKELSTDTATCLYCGLMTDTGNFAFNSNNPVLYEMIAELLRAGINKDRIFDNVFNQYTSNRMELMGYCLFRKMKIYKKYHTALITLSSSELRRFGYQKGDTEGFVNLPLQISDVYYSVFMREDSDRIKLSFRSQGDRPVNILAHDIFNGGGHMNAAGGESFGTLDNTVKTFEDHFRNYFNK
ncbi:MAG: bifunctional oligoribonuclease/PAP phosphatase NrnA [Bacteroidales bacterium]|jgi:phosphoesterase RecJ-like protein|nr:bifunctional oligoribonuclease/PAP phosphatase NrnA [Bacteroidales bacterium]